MARTKKTTSRSSSRSRSSSARRTPHRLAVHAPLHRGRRSCWPPAPSRSSRSSCPAAGSSTATWTASCARSSGRAPGCWACFSWWPACSSSGRPRSTTAGSPWRWAGSSSSSAAWGSSTCISGKGGSDGDLEQGGGALGHLLSSTLADLISPLGRVRGAAGHRAGGHPAALRHHPGRPSSRPSRGPAARPPGPPARVPAVPPWRCARAGPGRGVGAAARPRSPVARSAVVRRRRPRTSRLPTCPSRCPARCPMSQTVWAGSGRRGARRASAGTSGAAGGCPAASVAGAGSGRCRRPVRSGTLGVDARC